MKRRLALLGAVLCGFVAGAALLRGDSLSALGWVVATVAVATLAERVPS